MPVSRRGDLMATHSDSGSDTEPGTLPEPKPPFDKRRAWAYSLVSVVLLVLSVTKLEHLASRVDVVDLQWAGSATAAKMLVLQQAGPYRTAIRWDFALIAAYTVALVIAGHLGRHVFWTRRMTGAARVAIVAAVAAAACNLAQDGILLYLLRNQPMRGVW